MILGNIEDGAGYEEDGFEEANVEEDAQDHAKDHDKEDAQDDVKAGGDGDYENDAFEKEEEGEAQKVA